MVRYVCVAAIAALVSLAMSCGSAEDSGAAARSGGNTGSYAVTESADAESSRAATGARASVATGISPIEARMNELAAGDPQARFAPQPEPVAGDDVEADADIEQPDVPERPEISVNCEAEPSVAFMSYDESLSISAAQLSYDMLDNGNLDRWALSALARPYEFLNLTEFDDGQVEDLGRFKVDLTMTRYPSPSMPGTQLVDVGILVKGPDLPQADRRSLVLTLVLDVSGSMKSTLNSYGLGDNLDRFEAMKIGLTRMLNQLKDSDVINVISFSDRAKLLQQGVRATSAGKQTLRTTFTNLEIEASTNLWDGLQRGYAVAEQTFDDNKMNRVLLVTDFNLNAGMVQVDEIGRQANINNGAGIYLSGIGVSNDVNEQAMNSITEGGKGAAVTVLDNKSLADAFTKQFLALMEPAAIKLKYRLETPAHWVPFGSAAEERSAVESEVQESNFFVNTDQYILETFIEQGSCSDETSTVSFAIQYTTPAGGRFVEESVSKPVREILDSSRPNLRQARLVTMIPQVLSGQLPCSDAKSFLDVALTPESEKERVSMERLRKAMEAVGGC